MRFLENHETIEFDPDKVIDGIEPSKLQYHLSDVFNQEPRKVKYRSLRLSEIDSACPREWVLGRLLDLFYYQKIPIANRWQMDLGTLVHWHVQNNPKYFGDRLVGWWKCMACGYRRRFGVRPQEPCEMCKAHPRVTEYDEYMFRLREPYRVVGKVDLILRVAPRIYRYGEVKTCSKDMTSPDGSHVAQTLGYNYFSRYDDQLPITIDRSVSYIFYFNKKFNYKGHMRIFPIKPTELMLNPLIEKARIITEGVKNRQFPEPLVKCVKTNFSPTSGRSAKCGIAKECKKQFEMGVNTL
jgi:hypothetical protein